MLGNGTSRSSLPTFERSFEAIFEHHYSPLLSYCRHLLGDRDEAEDALQQAFIRAHRALRSGGAPRELRPWLYAIARNCCLSAIAARRPAVPLAEDTLDRGSGSLDGLAVEVGTREDLRQLLAGIAELPEDQRSALLLAELDDLSHVEIAAVVGCPVSKVKALVYQARQALIADRQARETSCREIREQLAVARAGELRRGPLRRHLKLCSGCREFQVAVAGQQRSLAVLLPVAPSAGFAAALFGHGAVHAVSAGTASGAGAAAGAVGAGATTGPVAAGGASAGVTSCASAATGAGVATSGGAAAGASGAAGIGVGAVSGSAGAAGAGAGASGAAGGAAVGAMAGGGASGAAGGAAGAGAGASGAAGGAAVGAMAGGGASATTGAVIGGAGVLTKLAAGGAVAVMAAAGAGLAATRQDAGHGGSHSHRAAVRSTDLTVARAFDARAYDPGAGYATAGQTPGSPGPQVGNLGGSRAKREASEAVAARGRSTGAGDRRAHRYVASARWTPGAKAESGAGTNGPAAEEARRPGASSRRSPAHERAWAGPHQSARHTARGIDRRGARKTETGRQRRTRKPAAPARRHRAAGAGTAPGRPGRAAPHRPSTQAPAAPRRGRDRGRREQGAGEQEPAGRTSDGQSETRGARKGR
jgi:RNA polymerase sigma factor (sigma-70 family)